MYFVIGSNGLSRKALKGFWKRIGSNRGAGEISKTKTPVGSKAPSDEVKVCQHTHRPVTTLAIQLTRPLPAQRPQSWPQSPVDDHTPDVVEVAETHKRLQGGFAMGNTGIPKSSTSLLNTPAARVYSSNRATAIHGVAPKDV